MATSVQPQNLLPNHQQHLCSKHSISKQLWTPLICLERGPPSLLQQQSLVTLPVQMMGCLATCKATKGLSVMHRTKQQALHPTPPGEPLRPRGMTCCPLGPPSQAPPRGSPLKVRAVLRCPAGLAPSPQLDHQTAAAHLQTPSLQTDRQAAAAGPPLGAPQAGGPPLLLSPAGNMGLAAVWTLLLLCGDPQCKVHPHCPVLGSLSVRRHYAPDGLPTTAEAAGKGPWRRVPQALIQQLGADTLTLTCMRTPT